MMYASKILIDYKPQKVQYQREIELPDGRLKIEDISIHLKDGETFSFEEREVGHFGTTPILHIYGFRNETQIEIDERVSKQEKYNENYEKHLLKYPRK
jgi:hypothetical protein